ncbi:hypothetical protein BGZ61DRAFT_487535 [Ilyonectria robusta]|uniref:uncharacterized protein n=1 Tax=Ilyonectria robusta TaxID=1079257 RepID=UPI001E8D4F44|nr:uncharacterized protein BGZ61DRAFT_487535 [Ilyonectria robusta]KAH8651979.1 hypothetical protein BGZ61DRAFT_487535 [Ilyonectria robusta]
MGRNANSAHCAPEERGMDDTEPQSLEQIVDGLGRAYDENDVSYDEDQQLHDERSREELEYEGMGSFLDEILASGMFPLDTAPRATDADKLQFAIDTIRGGHTNAQEQPPNQPTGSAQDSHLQPYIHISRGNEFADINDSGILQKHFQHYSPSASVGHGVRKRWNRTCGRTVSSSQGISVIETVLERVERMRFRQHVISDFTHG